MMPQEGIYIFGIEEHTRVAHCKEGILLDPPHLHLHLHVHQHLHTCRVHTPAPSTSTSTSTSTVQVAILLKRCVARARDEVVFRLLLHPRRILVVRKGWTQAEVVGSKSFEALVHRRHKFQGMGFRRWCLTHGCSHTSTSETSVPRVNFICSKSENHFTGSCHRCIGG